MSSHPADEQKRAFDRDTFTLVFKWTLSLARDTYGYNVCTLLVDGKKAARCNGGGYDMVGTVMGTWMSNSFPTKLNDLIKEPMYGLTFHDPDFNPGTAIVPDTGKTVDAMEAANESFGLERYQAVFSSSSPVPTPRHRLPYLDGASGMESVIKVLEAIGGQYKVVASSANQTIATVSIPRVVNHEPVASIAIPTSLAASTAAEFSIPERSLGTMSEKQKAETNGQQQTAAQEPPQRNPPLYEMKLNGLEADVQVNESDRGTFFSVTITRPFTGRDGTVKAAYSIREQDIPSAIQLLEEAKRCIAEERAQNPTHEPKIQVTRSR